LFEITKEERSMSETSTLIGHSGRTIGREELALVPTPFSPRTMWRLSNAFTSAFKNPDPVRQVKATAKLGAFLAQLPNELVISASRAMGSGDHVLMMLVLLDLST
jgi:hypothetical protein